MDFSIWSILQAKVFSKKHHSLEVRKAYLHREWTWIPHAHIRAACDAFIDRLIQAMGGYIEELLYFLNWSLLPTILHFQIKIDKTELVTFPVDSIKNVSSFFKYFNNTSSRWKFESWPNENIETSS